MNKRVIKEGIAVIDPRSINNATGLGQLVEGWDKQPFLNIGLTIRVKKIDLDPNDPRKVAFIPVKKKTAKMIGGELKAAYIREIILDC